MQTIGITDMEIRYHRPAVNKRKIWDGLVPYGVVWRAGANEGTTISFSTPVKVEGRSIEPGMYGLFMIPGASRWTVALSHFPGGWGTYSYDPSEDAARVEVSPQPVPEPQERLLYTFDDLGEDAATLSLRWEKLRIPIRISVDVPATVRASIRDELRGGKHWNADAWTQASRWELAHDDVDAALADADHAISLNATFGALRAKAAALEKKGDAKGAAELRERAKARASEGQSINLAVGPLLQQKKYDEAVAWLSDYAAKHPQSRQLWGVYAAIGDAYAGKHDLARARQSWEKAMSLAHDMAEKVEVQDSINAAGAGE
jgi:predicted negative regulator of RcsB-dependent stress response